MSEDIQPHVTYDKEEVRRRLPFLELVGKLMPEALRRSGSSYVMACPFHDERTPSFHVQETHGWCYGGCSEDGKGWDIFRFWMDVHGCDFPTALAALAERAGVGPTVQCTVDDCTVYSGPKSAAYNEWKGRSFSRDGVAAVDGSAAADGLPVKPVVPAMRRMRPGEKRALAELRGLSLGAIETADALGRLAFCEWPQWQGRDGAWNRGKDMGPAWVVADGERWVYQFRRFDGGTYEMGSGFPKAVTKGSPKWPIGCSEIGDRRNVLLCEGGADMLAAFHFLQGLGGLKLLDEVAVCAILGAGMKIREDALGFFRGKRVRIMMDADAAKPRAAAKKAGNGEPLAEPFYPDGHEQEGEAVVPKGWYVPSQMAAKRWTEQLTAAGAAVEVFSLYGLRMADGERVGDLNDLALCDAVTIGSEEVQDAFFTWDF